MKNAIEVAQAIKDNIKVTRTLRTAAYPSRVREVKQHCLQRMIWQARDRCSLSMRLRSRMLLSHTARECWRDRELASLWNTGVSRLIYCRTLNTATHKVSS